MPQWDVLIARRLGLTVPLARLYGAIGRAQNRLGHRGAVLSLIAVWHIIVAASLIGYAFDGGVYRLVAVVPAQTWSVAFGVSAGWSAATAWARPGRDRSGFYVSSVVTLLWGTWLTLPATPMMGDGGWAGAGIRSGGAFCVIGALLIICGTWRER